MAPVTVPTVVVVGLGPADASLLTVATRERIDAAPVAYLRTRRHPAAAAFPALPTFDERYDRAEVLDEVYPAIVAELRRAAAEHGTVVYAVPGSPLVAERTVELLRAAATDDPAALRVEIEPAVSFLDLTWTRLGVDPVAAGVRLIDGQRFAVEAAGERGPLLVSQCDSVDVLSEIKLAIGDALDVAELRAAAAVPGPTITVLQRLGLPDEAVTTVPWYELDREVVPDHLTSLWIADLAAPVAAEVQRFVDLVAVLRRECPWDREQTHTSLSRHLLEEAYEVLDALAALDEDGDPAVAVAESGVDASEIGGGGYEHLEEELGDLLFQVVFHCAIAAEHGRFTLADVARGIHDKLYARHPHVFGGVPDGLAPGDTAAEVVANWEQIKKAEKGRASIFEGIPADLPSLLFALKIQKKAASLGEIGEDLPSPSSWDHVVTTARRTPTTEAIGDLLFAVVNMARHAAVDPELALRTAALRYRAMVQELER